MNERTELQKIPKFLLIIDGKKYIIIKDFFCNRQRPIIYKEHNYSKFVHIFLNFTNLRT